MDDLSLSIYKLHEQDFRKHFYAETGQQSDVDDLMHDLYERLEANPYKPDEEASPFTWLYSLGRTCLYLFRYRQWTKPVSLDDVDANLLSYNPFHHVNTTLDVQRVLANMAPMLSMVARLLWIEGRTIEECTSILKRNRKTVEKWRDRAYKQLREELADYN